MKKVIILGASSGIGRALADIYVNTDAKVAILARNESKLCEIASGNNKYISMACDITNTKVINSILDEVCETLQGVDLVIVSSGVGELNPDLKFELEEQTLKTNVLGWCSAVDWAINRFEKQGFGHLVSISSVGGIRGDATAPAYSASKAFQINYMEGMCQKVSKLNKNIYTTDIRPGFIDTAMAKGDGIFWKASLTKAGKQIYEAIEKKRRVAYVTKRWALVAFVLKRIPLCIYRKM